MYHYCPARSVCSVRLAVGRLRRAFKLFRGSSKACKRRELARTSKTDVNHRHVSWFSGDIIRLHLPGSIPPAPTPGAFVFRIVDLNPFPDIGTHVVKAIHTTRGRRSRRVTGAMVQEMGNGYCRMIPACVETVRAGRGVSGGKG